MRINKLGRAHTRLLLTVAILSAGGTAYAIYGGGIQYSGQNDGFIGDDTVLDDWFLDEPCFTNKPVQRNDYPDIDAAEFVIDVAGVEADGDPNTFVRCRQLSREQMTCEVGAADGTVAACLDQTAPSQMPQPGDVVRLVFDVLGPDFCDVAIERNYDVIDPKCRQGSGSGGASGSGGSGSGGSTGPSTCNASTAQATLTTGQTTTIASNACVRLKNETTWSTVDPKLVPHPGTTSYPVPFTYTAPCTGQTSSGSLAGNYQDVYLFNGQGSSSNYGCDVFVKLGGNGSQVQFQYFQ